MLSAARNPKPFISVLTISIGAYCLRWNLRGMFRCGREQDHGNAPLVLAVAPAAAIIRETLDLRQAVDAVRAVAARDVRRVLACPIASNEQGKGKEVEGGRLSTSADKQ
jgi:hypothetical protein